ncbi:endolytic transglycosylase MltG [Nocardia sp. NPDC049190]|uniref:endolytic transglycosylase MltG n=1 Tax=Nocardia sp. NPDC049190 TaxID=3155650 RepID=UPI0033EDE5DD
MTDRWARAEELFRQREADRRYRRDDQAWAEHDDEAAQAHSRVGGRDDDEYDTSVIPRYVEDEYEDEDEYYDPPPRRPARRPETQRPRGAGRQEAPRRPKRAQPERAGRPQRGRRSRASSRKAAERKKRRRNLWVITGVFVLLFTGAVVFAGMKLVDGLGGPEDFAGPGGPLVVVHVQPGDTSQQIAATMVEKGVVASTGAFVQAAVRNSNMNSVQPGYYAIPSRSPAAEAVIALIAKSSRVGNLVVSEGRQLHDQQDVNTGSRKEGIYRKIADASCIGTGPTQKCVTYEQLDAAGATMDPAALGVPNWAAQDLRNVPDRSRQLEGLIAAGTLDFDPSGTPEQILAQVVTASARSYEGTGLLQSGTETKLSPYETLVAASLVEREALPQDMSKVARVIVNRLRVDQPLQFDSTVNYTLDRTEVATTDSDRATRNPWNTYAMAGLPATPISAPSLNALRAVENPEPGPWLYFVTIDKQGTTLFTDSYQEHLRNIEKARQSGILDSGR